MGTWLALVVEVEVGRVGREAGREAESVVVVVGA